MLPPINDNYQQQFNTSQIYDANLHRNQYCIYKLMEKKIAQISETFEHLRFVECLAIIEQTLKKSAKTDKKKQQITPSEMRLIKIFKVGCLVSLGQYHQANQVFQEVTDPQSMQIIGKDNNVFITLSIAQMFGENRQKAALEMFDKYSPNHNKNQIYRFYLSAGLYAPLGKLFLKDFVTTKQIGLQMAQIYLQYLQALDKFNLNEYERDRCYKYNESLKTNLKLVSMFTEKCVKTAEEQLGKLSKDRTQKAATLTSIQLTELKSNIDSAKKAIAKAVQLKLKIAINEGRVKQAIIIYETISKDLKFPFDFLRSILNLSFISEDKQHIYLFYINEISKIFRTNLNLKDYSPWYDHYNQFLQFILQHSQKQDASFKENTKLLQEDLEADKLYVFSGLDFKQIVFTYYRSILNEFRQLVDTAHPCFEQNKKSDYYKICIKGLLLQLIQIASFFSDQTLLLKYLSEYTKYFSSTLTFFSQLKAHKRLLIKQNIFTKPKQAGNDIDLIKQINWHRIFLSVQNKSFSYAGFQNILEQFSRLYTIRVKQVEKNRKLQKGERYLSDEYFTIISDYARAYVQQEESQSLIEKVTAIMINQLEKIVEVSPFNADTKLRLMYFCSLANHNQRLIEVFLSNDIKSVQMETLGYWFLKPCIQFGMFNNYEHFTERFVKSYHQNLRETSEYGLKALKSGELDRVDEYLCYRNCMLNSYNSVVLLYFLYQKYRFEGGAEYYLLKINERINKFVNNQKIITFNADSKVLANEIFQEFHFADFYGLFNRHNILQAEVNLTLHQLGAVNQLLQRSNGVQAGLIDLRALEQQFQSLQVVNLFNFEGYSFRQNKVHFNPQKSIHTLHRYSMYLAVFKSINQIRINVLLLINQFIKYLKTQNLLYEKIQIIAKNSINSIQDLKKIYLGLSYRNQIWTISHIRRALFESLNLTVLLRQTVSKTKKLKFAKEAVQKSVSPIAEELITKIVELKWRENISTSADSKLMLNRDQALQRQLVMDSKQVKKIIGKFQNIYK